MKSLFFPSLRAQLVTIDRLVGIPRREIGQRPGREMIRLGLCDTLESDGETRLVLTELGFSVQELLLEIEAHERTFKRMREGAIATIVTPAGSCPLPATVMSRGSTCGSLNHDSFAAFLDSLNAAGKNRWRDPGFTGSPPPPKAAIPENGVAGPDAGTTTEAHGDQA